MWSWNTAKTENTIITVWINTLTNLVSTAITKNGLCLIISSIMSLIFNVFLVFFFLSNNILNINNSSGISKKHVKRHTESLQTSCVISIFFWISDEEIKDFKSLLNFSIILMQYVNEEAQFPLHLYSKHLLWLCLWMQL